MLEQPIMRQKPKPQVLKKTVNRAIVWGVIMCLAALAVGAMCIMQWPAFISGSVYGLFGLYTFAVLFFVLVSGIFVAYSRKISVSRRYVISSAFMLFSVLGAVHTLVTRVQLDLSFGDYLQYVFGNITPGGVVFAVPAFAVWKVFAGMTGSMIAFGIIFLVSSTLFTMQVVTKHGDNKVIKKRNGVFAFVEPNNKSYAANEKELTQTLDSRYQELLLTKGRKKLDKQKSELGLTTPPNTFTPPANYDSAVPLQNLPPSQPFIADEINQWSTDAANKFQSGLQPPMFSAPQNQWAQQQVWQPPMAQPQMPQPQWGQSGLATQNPWVQGGQNGFGQPQNPTTNPWGQPAPTPFGDPNVSLNYPQTDDTAGYVPTARARNPRPLAPEQTGISEVLSQPKPKNYKPRRYTKPTIDLVRTESTDLSDFHSDAARKQAMLDAKLREFDINAKVTSFTVAPAITRFDIQIGAGTRTNEVYRLERDFQYILGTENIRMENVPGKNAIGVEVPNEKVGCVSLKDILGSREFQQHKSPLAVAIGKDVNDEIVIGDICAMPHLLVAGSTGSGKSVCINSILTSLVYRANPDEVKLLLVDPKSVELNLYNGIPHMLVERAITDVHEAINALKWLQTEMARRYKILEANGCNKVAEYHALPAYQSGQFERIPYILMVIDEAADLLNSGKREVEDAVKRLGALARAAGIHIILATQRPSVDVITSVIKANFPVRIGFKVSSPGDSQTIINERGCDKLVGRGDMLYSLEGAISRVQGAFIERAEANRVMNNIRDNNTGEFDKELEDLILNGPPPENAAAGFGDGPSAARNQDPLFVAILRWLVRDDNINQTASIAGIQRQFSLGFSRAGRIMDQFAAAGYVSQGNGAKVREVLISRAEVESIYGIE